MTADGQGEDELRIGVVLEAFLDWPLEQILTWLPAAAPEVTHLEIGAGGYAPHPHCDVVALLASGQARSAWLAAIAGAGLQVDALNAWGNPLHPDRDLAREHDRALRDAIRLAALLGVSRVVALAGCPGGAAGDQVPHFGAGGWLPYLEGIYQRQWEEQIAPYWAGLAEFAAAENPELRVCLELHPGTCVFNVETFGRVAALGPAIAGNLDPSHFFWMGMDGHRVASALGDRIGHVHGKDTVFHAESLALNGLLDRRWPEPAAEMPWTFAVPGRGHDLAWWTGLVRALGGSAARVISIEHEDPFVPATTGVPEAARLLRAAIDAALEAGHCPGSAVRVRVGLVGTGVIAQVMHLHYLAELADRYEVAAVCDLDADSARACAGRYGIPAVFTDWRDLLGHPLDAVLVLTSGSHAPIAEAAARAGLHVFVEKPMCFSAAEGRAMVAAAERAGVKLMVGYPKRYDPAFARMREETAQLTDARMLRVTTFESPLRPYIEHYPLLPRAPLPAAVAAGLQADSDERIRAAVGAGQRPGAAGLRQRAARHPGPRAEHRPWPARRADPAGVREPGPGLCHGDAQVRVAAGGHPLDRPAGHRPVRDGVRAVRAGTAAQADVPFAVPAQRTGHPGDRGRRRRFGPGLAHRGGRQLRERVQARTRGVPRLDRRGPRAGHRGPRWPARHHAVPGHHRQPPPRRPPGRSH